MWFSSPSRLLGLAAVLVLSYGWLVVVLRLTGKRTLAKLNAFDFVVTIALGSTLSAVVVSQEVPLVDGMVALLGLVALQFVVALLAVRLTWFDRLVKADPTALVVRGELQHEAMARCRVRADEIGAALRKQGVSSPREVDLVVLETDGTISVVRRVEDWSTLTDVDGLSEDAVTGS
jgi:uncharacterized membrane protein YcaP (DUF421 family)